MPPANSPSPMAGSFRLFRVGGIAVSVHWTWLLVAAFLLPVYPLDGGQILQALLWFVIGRVKSLLVVSVIGLVVAAVAIVVALAERETWFVILAAFVALRSWAGFRYARVLAAAEAIPRRPGVACPSCGAHPPVGPYWG